MERFDHLHVGVLALQGDYELHEHQLGLLGIKQRRVRLPSDLNDLGALIMPGGETTTMAILIDRFGLRKPLIDFGRSQPVYGTCAGMVLLARHIEDNQAGVNPLQLMDIDVLRNGYGRQVYSFEETLRVQIASGIEEIRAAFIRAPKVTRLGSAVETLSVYQGSAVLVAEKNILAASFHTELEDDTSLLRCFLSRSLDRQVVDKVP